MIAYGIALLLAVGRASWRAPLLYLGALWYAFHALNHIFDVGEAVSSARGWADTLLIAARRRAARLARVGLRPLRPRSLTTWRAYFWPAPRA